MKNYLQKLKNEGRLEDLSMKICSKLVIGKVEIDIIWIKDNCLGTLSLFDANNDYIAEFSITDYECTRIPLTGHALKHKSYEDIHDRRVKNAYISSMAEMREDYKESYLEYVKREAEANLAPMD